VTAAPTQIMIDPPPLPIVVPNPTARRPPGIRMTSARGSGNRP
jgi:hypothetical protein